MKHFFHFRRMLAGLILLLTAHVVQGQTAASYVFAPIYGVDPEPQPSNFLIGQSSTYCKQSAVTDIGFSFVFAGTTYTQFTANASGIVQLGAQASTACSFPNSIGPSITPANDEFGTTGYNGSVRYGVVGSAPNRKLVVDWQQSGGGVPDAATRRFQVWLFEGSNAIQLVYISGKADPRGYDVAIGIASSLTDYLCVDPFSNTASSVSVPDAGTFVFTSGKSFRFEPFVAGVSPTISGFTPTGGPAGTEVTVSGSRLSGATGVRVNGTPGTIVNNSGSSLTFTVGAGTTSGRISLSTPDGLAASTDPFALPPTITSFDPTGGITGSNVTITGVDLAAVTEVAVNGTPGVIVGTPSNTSLTFTVSAGSTSGPISVTNAAGTSASTTNYTVTGGLSGISPTSGAVGTQVVINGASLNTTTSVMFGAVPAPFTINSASQLTATVPRLASTGQIRIIGGVVQFSGTAFPVTRPNTTTDYTLLQNNFASNANSNAVPAVTDFDNDGKLDLLIGRADGSISHYEQSAVNGASFTLITHSFSSINVGGNAAPAITDFNGNGKLDLVVGRADGTLSYYEQSAVNSDVFTLVTNNFNGIDTGDNSAPAFTDLNGDGRVEMLLGKLDGSIGHFEQTSTTSTSFTRLNSNFNNLALGATSSLKPFVADLDGDGLLDLLFGKADGSISHYEQNGANSIGVVLVTNNFAGLSANGNAAPHLTDLDGDGNLDLLLGRSNGSLDRYEQAGQSPTITSLSPTSGPAGTVVTVNGTNLSGTSSVLLRGIPSRVTPISDTQVSFVVPGQASSGPVRLTTPGGTALSTSSFTVTRTSPTSFTLRSDNFNSINVGSRSTPTFTDLDGDGLLDMLVGEDYGTLYHYEQSAPNATSFTLVSSSFSDIDVGALSNPTFTDLDGDGLLDMIVGKQNGTLNHYEQSAPNATSFTLVTESFNDIDVVFRSAPTFTDLDGDGLLDLLVGDSEGTLSHYEQSAPNTTTFTLRSDNFSNIGAGSTSTSAPTFTDLDGDGLLDLLLGQTFGPMRHYEQSAPNATTFTLVSDFFNDINVGGYSTPTFTDLDGDGLLDMIVGESGGNLNHYEQALAPTITSFAPTSGPVGTSITVTGTNLEGATAARVNGTAGTITANDATSLTFTVAAGSTTGPVSVTTPGGTATGANFTVQVGPATRYVNASRPDDNGDGLSWATAHKYLQTALTAAQSGDQIWVAQGTYKPTTSTDRTISFVMKENVKIYGGFTSGQANLTDRNTDPATNNTILSGDINNDNALAGNSYHVILNINNGLTAEAVLDGFTITGGNGDGTGAQVYGGGMFCVNSSPTIIRCIFRANAVSSSGGYGGAVALQSNSSPLFVNCSFEANEAGRGGGVSSESGSPKFTNCSFVGNSAPTDGGAFSTGTSSSPQLTNCSFLGNRANRGEAIMNQTSSILLTNCVLFGNGNLNEKTIFNTNATVSANYCLIEAGETDYSGSNNLTTSVNPFVSNESTELSPCSPAIDAGDDAANSTTIDLAGNVRKVRTIDMGAFEYQGTLPVITATLGGGGSICGISSASLSVNITGGTGPYTLVYATNGGAQSTLSNYVSNSTIQVSPAQTTTYSLISVTDANGCTASTLSGSATVTVNPLPTATVSGGGTVCEGATAPDVSIALTGGGPYSVTYTNGTTPTTVNNISTSPYVITNPAAGTYTVTAVSNASCTGTASGSANVTINPRPAAPTLSASPGTTTTNQPITVSAAGCENGTVSWNTTGGTDNGNSTYTFSAAGSYSISATCTVGGCVSPASQTLNLTINNCTLALGQPTVTNLTCFNSGDGAIALTATGGSGALTYTLSPGNLQNATGSFTGLSAGSYTVSVSDASQCSATSGTIAITQPAAVPAPTLSANPGTTTTNQPITVSAAGCAGTLSWNTSGGTDNGNGTYTFSTAGNYSISATCTVGGCVSPASQTLNLTINSCTLALGQPTVTNLTCFESGDGAIALTATGGSGALTYTLSPGNLQNATGSFTGLSAGSYTVSVSDASQCSATSGTIAITQPAAVPAPTLSANPGTTTTNQPITVSAAGCAGTLSWNTSGGTDNGNGTYTFTDAGSYSISATCTVGGCTSPASQTLNLTINSCALALGQPTVTNLTCFESGDGAIALTATGGSGSLTYTLSPGNIQNATGSFSGLSAGSYTVSVSDANSCTATSGSIAVTQPAAVPAPTLSANPGTTTTNQPITVSAAGCAGTLSWNTTGGTDNNDGTYTFTDAGSYTISATCTVGGCVSPASQALNLTINNCTLALGTPSVTNLTCFESGDGAIALTATGGAGSLNYTLSPGSGQNATGSFSGLSAGSYTVSVTDANNCTATSASIAVTQPAAVPAPTLSANPGNTTTNQPITVSAAGCENGTVSWNTTGGTDNGDGTYTFTDAGNYSISATCTVEDCTSPASQTLNLTINSCTLALGTPSVTNLTCFESGDGAIALTATGGSGSLTYTLSPGNVQNTSGSFSGLSAGSYTVSVSDANSCTATSGSIQVTQPAAVPAPTLSASPGNTTTNQPITVSASGCAGTLSWNTSGGTDNGDGTYTFSAAGSYSISATCTVGGCVSPASQTLNLTINNCTLALGQPTVTNLTCFESGDGAIALTATGGSGSLTYTLSPGNVQNTSGSFSGLSAGSYTVSVTDASQCSATSGSISLTQPAAVPAPTLSASPGTTTTNQPITVTASGCSGTISWNTTGGTDNNDGTYTFTDAGNYSISATCTVEDCTSPASQTLNLTINSCTLALGQPTVSNLSCFESGDGAIALTATGGSGSLTYTLSPGNGQNATGSFNGLSAGTYTVSVTDANQCSAASGSISLTQPAAVPAPTLSANPGTTTTNQPITVTASGCNGTVSWTATGGMGVENGNQYTFSQPGNYTVSATCTVDGCTSPASQTLNLSIGECPTITLNIDSRIDVACFGASSGRFTVTAVGGASPYAYSIGGQSQGNGTFTDLPAGTYSVTVTDANGCMGSTSVTVNQPATALSVQVSGNTTVIYGYGSSCTTLAASASGGTGQIALAWSTGATGGTVQVCPTQTTSYTVTATDAAGCSVQKQVTVTVTDVRCGYGGVTMCQGGREACVAQYLVPTYLRFGYQLGPCNTGNTRQAAEEVAEPTLSLSLKAYPNPTTGHVTVQVQSPAAGRASFELVSAQGRTVHTQAQQLSEGLNEVPFELGAQPAGNYLIRCIDALGHQATVRINRQ